MKIGNYNLIRKIAEGGVAEIYLAKTHSKQGGDKYLVCKCIKESLTSDMDFLASIIQEAQLSIKMRHPNILEVFDLCSVDGRAFLTMEYMNSPDFQGILQQCRKSNETIPYGPAIYVICETAKGLHYAHELEDELGQPLNLVHRDISPENILLNSRGDVKLSDFGIAKTCQMPDITPPDTVKGKFAYMSPEQAWADPLDRRSDIFSLAIVLYETLLGCTIYDQSWSIADILMAARIAQFRKPTEIRPDFPADLEAIILKALDLDISLRYNTADAFRRALEECAAHHQWDCSREAWCNWLSSHFPENSTQLPVMRAAEIPDDASSIIRHQDRSIPDLTPDLDRTVIVSRKFIEEQGGGISSSNLKAIRDKDSRSSISGVIKYPSEGGAGGSMLRAIKLPSELIVEKYKSLRDKNKSGNSPSSRNSSVVLPAAPDNTAPEGTVEPITAPHNNPIDFPKATAPRIIPIKTRNPDGTGIPVDKSLAKTSDNNALTTAQIQSPFYQQSSETRRVSMADIAASLTDAGADDESLSSLSGISKSSVANPAKSIEKSLNATQNNDITQDIASSSETADLQQPISLSQTADLSPMDLLTGSNPSAFSELSAVSKNEDRRKSDSQLPQAFHDAANASRIGPASISMPSVSKGTANPNVTRPSGMKSEIHIPDSDEPDPAADFHSPNKMGIANVDFSMTVPEIPTHNTDTEKSPHHPAFNPLKDRYIRIIAILSALIIIAVIIIIVIVI